VALKLVKAGMNTREVIARFESERQALALMDHPAIAKVFDAGSTPQGAPYFVMEYIAGVTITAYCDNRRLNTRERLQLFIHVCEGAQHAHQKAIIHRDLKPSNILVTEVDGKAAPKIIDFGVAKALSHKLTADTMFTRLGALIGTPEYMSPEQANSSGEDIDTRTDVYSLGVIFYELLAGVPPIDLRKIAFDEFLRRLREEDPPKPSTKIRTHDPATSTDVARKRQSEPLALARQIRGDLDSIALKALGKNRTRRYGSPSDLAADVERYLKNEAVLAVPPSAAYRARKFAAAIGAP
jgi:eukaryotic-like serine/threonine-protein kinase